MFESYINTAYISTSTVNFNAVYRAICFIAPANATKVNTFKLVYNSSAGSPAVGELSARIWSISATGVPSAAISAADIVATGTYTAGGQITFDFTSDNHTLTAGTRYAIVFKNANATPTTVYPVFRTYNTALLSASNFNSNWSTGSKNHINSANVYTSPDGATWTNQGLYDTARSGHRWTFDSGEEWGIELPTIAGTATTANIYPLGHTTPGECNIFMPGDVIYNIACLYVSFANVSGTYTATIKFENALGVKEYTIGDTANINATGTVLLTPGLKILGNSFTRITLPGGSGTNYVQIVANITASSGVNLPSWMGKSWVKSGATTYSGFAPIRFGLDGEQPFSPIPINRRKFNSVR